MLAVPESLDCRYDHRVHYPSLNRDACPDFGNTTTCTTCRAKPTSDQKSTSPSAKAEDAALSPARDDADARCPYPAYGRRCPSPNPMLSDSV